MNYIIDTNKSSYDIEAPNDADAIRQAKIIAKTRIKEGPVVVFKEGGGKIATVRSNPCGNPEPERQKQWRPEKRGDFWYVGLYEGTTRLSGQNTSFTYRDEALKYANILNKANRHPLVNPRRNPESAVTSLYEEFHGEPPQETLQIEETVHEHEWLATLGDLMQLKIANKDAGFTEAEINFNGFGTDYETEFNEKDNVRLCSSEDGLQLYVRGGDQAVDLAGLKMNKKPWVRDKMLLGTLIEFTYRTEKGFDKFDILNYYHHAGEDTKIRPVVVYDNKSNLIEIVGGQYEVKPEGVVN